MSSLSSNEAIASSSSSGGGGGLEFLIHPLVVMSIADHHTRIQIQSPDKPSSSSSSKSELPSSSSSPSMPSSSSSSSSTSRSRALGLLFGTQDGRSVTISETVEIAYKTNPDGSVSFSTYKDDNEDKLLVQIDTDKDLFAQCYENLECLGWYATGSMLPNDILIHRQITQYNDRPIFLVLDTDQVIASLASKSKTESPIQIYEESVSIVNGEMRSEFVKANTLVVSDEAERVTMLHCAKVINNDESGSAVTFHYSTLTKAVTALQDRVRVLHSFLTDVKNGKVDADQPTLRSLKGLMNHLPTMESPEFRKALTKEYNDALLISLLAAMTKGTNEAVDLTDKFNIANTNPEGARESRRGRLDRMHMDDFGSGFMGMGGMGGMGMGMGMGAMNRSMLSSIFPSFMRNV